MAKVNIIITDAGLAEIVNAENNGTAPVVLETIAVGTGKYTPSASQTSLISEIKRFYSISGGAIGDNVIHINAEDASDEAYTVYELGVFTASGTLFAVTSQSTPIISKAKAAQVILAIDIALTNINPDSITFGDTNFIINSATTERQGIIELATTEEAKAATDTFRAIVPKVLDEVIEGHANIVHRSGAETISGIKTFGNNILGDAENFSIGKTTSTGNLVLRGGAGSGQGGGIALYGKEYGESYNSSYAGSVQIETNGETKKTLILYPNGQIIWDGKHLARTVNGLTADANGNIVVQLVDAANRLATARTITLSGDASGSISFDGSANKTLTVQIKMLPLAGGTMTGTIKTSVNQALVKTDTKGGIQVCGGTNLEDGGSILGYGMNYELNPEFKGALRLQATDGTKTYDIVLFPDGRMRLGNGAQLNFQDNEEQRIFIDKNGDLLCGDTNIGALLRLRGNNSEDNPGGFQIRAEDANGKKYLIGKPDGTLTWEGTQLPVPTGTVIAFAANANPEGYVICNGSAVSRTVYARLFAVIGTTYGAGDGSTTFNLPNLTGRFIEGASAVGVYKEAGLPNIIGEAGIGDNAQGSKLLAMNTCSGALAPSEEGTNFSYSNTYSTAGKHYGGLAFNANASNPIYGRSDTVQPPALTMRYFIKW